MDAMVIAGASGGTTRVGPSYRFPSSSRLLKHPRFEAVYKNGRRQFSANMTVFYLLGVAATPAGEAIPANAQVGFTVGKILGGAVERNRIKRRTRDAVRQNLDSLNQVLRARGLSAEIVINPKKSALKAEHTILRAEISRAFEVIGAAKPGPGNQSRNRADGSHIKTHAKEN